MSSFSDARADALLGQEYRDAANSLLGAQVYLALCTSAPAKGNTAADLVEPVDTNYARQSIAIGAATWTAPAAGTPDGRKVDNVNQVDFGTAAANYPAAVTHWALVSSASGAGAMHEFGALSQSQTPTQGGSIFVAAGALVVRYT